MLLINGAHKSSRRGKNLIDEDENGLFWGELDALSDHVDELPNSQIRRHQILFLIDGCDVAFFDLLADYWNPIGVLLSDAFGLSLALLERVLVLELRSHIDGLMYIAVFGFVFVVMRKFCGR